VSSAGAPFCADGASPRAVPNKRSQCLRSAASVSYRHSHPVALVAMSDEVGLAPRMIDVEADAQFTTHMVTKSHTERPNLVGPVRDGNNRAGAIAIRQLRASARHEVERTVNLLRDRTADAGLQVVRLIDVERVLNVAPDLQAQSRRALRHIRQVDRCRSPLITRHRGIERHTVAIADPRGALEQRERVEGHVPADRR
jgi:hypothetical protein